MILKVRKITMSSMELNVTDCDSLAIIIRLAKR